MYPCLIPEWALNATATVSIASEGVNEDGEIIPEFTIEQKCNLQLKSEVKLDSKKQAVSISGKAYFQGDICPDIRTICGGKVTCNDVDYSINGASITFSGESANCQLVNGIIVQRDVYEILNLTGLTCLSLGV